MAGYVKLMRSIWHDADFTALPPLAQRLYLLLISQPDITSVGVLPFTAGRWSTLSPGLGALEVRADLDRLQQARFVLIDPDTEEVWVRSYIMHDKAFTSPNGRTSLDNALEQVVSAPIRAAIEGVKAGVPVWAGEGAGEAPGSPQQPAASIHEPFPPAASSSQTNVIDSSMAFLDNTQRDTAAAALETWIEFRTKEATPKFPAKFRATLTEGAASEWGEHIAQFFHGNPAASRDELLFEVFGINPSTMKRRAS